MPGPDLASCSARTRSSQRESGAGAAGRSRHAAKSNAKATVFSTRCTGRGDVCDFACAVLRAVLDRAGYESVLSWRDR
eukprot:1147509-Rhodomonas_salina.1